jgi:peptidoglycan hydrolase CwlO-like protein
MNPQPQQIDITSPDVTIEQLYKLALEQQKAVTNLFAQMQQAQANVAALEAEIEKRNHATPQVPPVKKNPFFADTPDTGV